MSSPKHSDYSWAQPQMVIPTEVSTRYAVNSCILHSTHDTWLGFLAWKNINSTITAFFRTSLRTRRLSSESGGLFECALGEMQADAQNAWTPSIFEGDSDPLRLFIELAPYYGRVLGLENRGIGRSEDLRACGQEAWNIFLTRPLIHSVAIICGAEQI